ncbi:MAG TPA: hypothetical protein P5572_15245 [Phycisphaerae bacterium]|nr:hypothetical protein [Phycisphaerae bacterium]
MKTLLGMLTVSALAVTALGGCSLSSRGGGIDHEQSFRLVGPADTTVKQGEMEVVTIKLARGDEFKRDVKLDIRAPKGIRVEPNETKVAASQQGEVQLRITADKDAALGDYDVYVKGTPETGQPTSLDFTVNVTAG